MAMTDAKTSSHLLSHELESEWVGGARAQSNGWASGPVGLFTIQVPNYYVRPDLLFRSRLFVVPNQRTMGQNQVILRH